MLLRRCRFHTLRRTPLRALSEGSLDSSLRFIDGAVSALAQKNTYSMSQLVNYLQYVIKWLCLYVF